MRSSWPRPNKKFIDALESLKPAKLKRSGVFPKKSILEFFDACNTKMQLPSTRELLAEQFKRTKQPPNELIIKLQKDMLETLGFEREWACGKLNRIGQDFGEDRELVQGMQAWAAMAQQACRRAQADGDPSLRPIRRRCGRSLNYKRKLGRSWRPCRRPTRRRS